MFSMDLEWLFSPDANIIIYFIFIRAFIKQSIAVIISVRKIAQIYRIQIHIQIIALELNNITYAIRAIIF